MSIFKAVISTAISFALLSALTAAPATAQTTSAKPTRLIATQPAAQTRRPRNKPQEDIKEIEKAIHELKKQQEATQDHIRELNKQQEGIKRDIRELNQGREELRKELLEIKQLLARLPPARRAAPEKISIAARPSRGSETARVVIVEFSDYQCPFCALFFRQTLPQLDQEYIQTGKVRYVFNNVPLDQIHPTAFKAAEAAECASDQGKFWEMHDRIFSNQRTLSPNELTTHAKAIGLDLNQFGQCLDGGKRAPSVRAGLALAEEVGVDGTPTFVIALADSRNPQGTNLKVLSIISGAQPFTVFKSALDKALATP